VKIRVRDRAAFQPDRMARIGLSTTERTQLDLYCLEPGQAQRPHTHDAQDKIYVVLEGRGRFTLGDADASVEAGEVVVAPAGTPHGVANDSGARLLVLVVVAPPPPHLPR
jgi:quercetin dioxygenase-like cupin family protein